MARKVNASIVVMSHLSDVMMDMKYQPKTAELRINFAKYLILQLYGNLNQDIDVDAMYAKFSEKTPVMG